MKYLPDWDKKIDVIPIGEIILNYGKYTVLHNTSSAGRVNEQQLNKI